LQSSGEFVGIKMMMMIPVVDDDDDDDDDIDCY